MRTLKFKCSGQTLARNQACVFTGIVPGSQGYLQVQIDFDAEWAGLAKVAEFWTQDNKGAVYPVLCKNGICAVPDEVTYARVICLRIVGKRGAQKIITNTATIRQEG